MPNGLAAPAPAQPQSSNLQSQLARCRRSPWLSGASFIGVLAVSTAGVADSTASAPIAAAVGLAGAVFLGYVWWKLFQANRHLRRALELLLQQALDRERTEDAP
ncbi:MAG: hypothetical protein HYZ53_08035 [Planctomycetes bacterium]|nr:hypothetical protein [Planctomycetota bacterium]